MSKRSETLRREIRATLAERADHGYRIGELVSTDGEVVGVRVPEIRALVKEVKARHPDLTVEDAVALLDLVSRDKGREEMLFAIFLLTTFRSHLTSALWPHVDRWIHAIDNWEICDQLAMTVGGEIVARDLSLVGDLVAWAKAKDSWRRRFAVAATTALNQRGRSHPEETFRVLELVLGDPDPMLQKAVGWALREVSKHAEPATFRFLTERKEQARRRVLREGSEKLTAEHRARLLD